MKENIDVVQVKLDQQKTYQSSTQSKAIQMKLENNKTIIIYNRINGYILNAVLKAVFPDDH